MKAIWSIIFFLTITGQFTFGQKKSTIIFPPPVFGMNDPEFMSACELLTHKNELVYTRFVYSGFEEYWGLHSADTACKSVNANLEIPDSVTLRPKYRKLLKEVHERYWKYYLLIDVIGVFDNSNKRGYGHLGSNSSKFTVKNIINVQKVETKK